MHCHLEFYNPDYPVPKNFEECGKSTAASHRSEGFRQICTITLPPEAGEALLNQCVAAGGGKDSDLACILTFSMELPVPEVSPEPPIPPDGKVHKRGDNYFYGN